MTASLTKLAQIASSPLESEILDALPVIVSLVTAVGELRPVNKAAHEFWGKKSQKLDPQFLPLVERARERGGMVTVHDFSFVRDMQEYRATLHVAPVSAPKKALMLALDLKGAAHAPAVSAWKQEITRAAGVMAAMLAHEVKNPLSSIRGAAQLLQQTIPEAERSLADLICSETLRIRDIMDQVEIFSDERTVELAPLNIHEVLQYTMRVAKAGFAQHVTFIERYDPSLPPVLSQRELLVQVFLNIIKNACEALSAVPDATVTISTSYQNQVRLADRKLPVMVKIEDNGQGIPPEIRKKLFEPLVSTKMQGRGLGLSVVAKIAADLGAIVECDERIQQGAGFNIYLPMA